MTKYPCHICKTTTKQLFKSIDGSHAIPICKHHSNHKQHGTNVLVMTKKMTKKLLFAYSKKMHKFHRGYKKKKFTRSMNDLTWLRLKNKPCNFIQNNNIKATMLPYEFESFSKLNNTTIVWQYLNPLDAYIQNQQNEYSYSMKKHWYLIFNIVLRRFPNRVKKLIMEGFANLGSICIIDHTILMRDCKEYILNTCTRRLSTLATQANSALWYNQNLRQKFIREAWNGRSGIEIGFGLRLNAHSVPLKKFKLIYD